jgi:CysZ protein
MPSVVSSLHLALGQLAEPRVLRILAKSVAVTVALVVAIAWGGWLALDWGLGYAGLDESLFDGAGWLRQAAALALTLLGLWLVWRIVAMAVIGFFADEVVQAVEARHYPAAAARARDLPLGEQLSTSLRAALRALAVNLVALPFALALLFTGVGPALVFFLVNAVLVGRELEDMVWLRHRRGPADPAPVGRGERALLGGAVTALLSLPFVNLVAPILGAASATHLIHRKEPARETA